MLHTNLGIVFNKNVAFLKQNKIRLVALSFVAAMLVSVFVPMASVVTLSAGTTTNHNDSVNSFETKMALQNTAGVLESSDQVAVTADADSAAKSEMNGTVVDVPKDAAQGVTFGAESGTKLDIELPSAQQASDAKQVAPGVVGYDAGDGSASAVQPTEDGGVRMLTIIDNPNAPTAYDYKVTVPNGGSVQLTHDGGAAVVDRKQKLIAIVDRPWAKDAAGKSVATYFTSNGRALTQHVEHNMSGVVYPITADPQIKWRWNGVDVHLNRNETRYTSRISTAAAIGYLGWTGIGGAAAGAIGVAADIAMENYSLCLSFWKSYMGGNFAVWLRRC